MSIIRHLSVSTILLIVVLLSIIGYQAIGQSPRAAQSMRVATVDLERVFEGLEQRREASQRLQQMATELEQEREQRQAEIRKMEEQLRELVSQAQEKQQPLSEEAQRLQEDIVLHGLRFEAWVRYARAKLEQESSLILRDVFRTVRRAAERMADTEAYDLILIDDSRRALGSDQDNRRLTEAQVLQEIALRTILYARDSIDVTRDLIERMNNEHRAVGRQ
jgi:Skp family chaperone for outer membrane proteins